MADPRVNVILGAKDEASKVVKGLRGQFEMFKRDAVTGFGLGAGISVFNTATRAIGALVDIGSEAVRMAAEEEAEVVRLTASLEANVAAWDGNVEAIEDVLTARQRLGFSDSEQRDSLTKLLGATKDHTTALALNRQAMDLARFRGMDLAAASELITKVYAGNTSILRRYGIVVRRGATATEALAEIQKMAMGQAEAYAGTTLGKWAALELKIEDVKEEIGAHLLPALDDIATGAEAATDPLGTMSFLLGVLQANLEGGTVAFEATYQAMKPMAAQLHLTDSQLRGMIQRADDTNEPLARFGARVTSIIEAQDRLTQKMTAQGMVWDELTGKWVKAKPVIHQVTAGMNMLGGETVDLTNSTLALAASSTIAVGGFNKERKAIGGLIKRADELAGKRDQTGKRLQALTRESERLHRRQGRAAQEGSAAAVAAYQAAIDKNNQLQAELRATLAAAMALTARNFVINVAGNIATGLQGALGGGRRAGGGPVQSGHTYLVGEKGPELLHMGSQAGNITPNHRMGGGGGNVYLDGQLVGRVLDERMGRQFGMTAAGGFYRS
jgi:hypothetical protein